MHSLGSVQPLEDANPIGFGDVVVWPGQYRVERGGREVRLRPREFELLVALLRRPGRLMFRKDLLREVWGYQADVNTRTLDTHMAELRRKLEPDPEHPRYFVTLHRLGYRFDP